MNNKKFSSKKEINKIIKLYLEGNSLAKISKIFKSSSDPILRVLKENNIKLRTKSESHQKYYFDTSAFSIINEETAYWVGFLLADGYIQYRDNSSVPNFSLSAAIKDKKHILKFAKYLKTNKLPYYFKIKGKEYLRLEIFSTDIVKRLFDLGVTQRKSYTATPPEILIANRHFWRGMIDGDGCVNYMKKQDLPRITLAGSFNVIEQFLIFCRKYTPTGSNVYTFGNIFRTEFSGTHAFKMLDILYKNSTIYLNRKYKKALKLLKSSKNNVTNQ